MKISKEHIELSTVRMITLNEPFASLMAFHGKDETRNRDTKVRGLVAIHAAKVPYDNPTLRKFCSPRIIDIINKLVPYRLTNRSKIIAVGYLVATKYMGDHPHFKEEIENKCFVSYNPNLWIWQFEDMTPVEPIYMKGKQGWSILSDEVKQKLIPII